MLSSPTAQAVERTLSACPPPESFQPGETCCKSTDLVHGLAHVCPGSPEVEDRDPVEVRGEELLKVLGRGDDNVTADHAIGRYHVSGGQSSRQSKEYRTDFDDEDDMAEEVVDWG